MRDSSTQRKTWQDLRSRATRRGSRRQVKIEMAQKRKTTRARPWRMHRNERKKGEEKRKEKKQVIRNKNKREEKRSTKISQRGYKIVTLTTKKQKQSQSKQKQEGGKNRRDDPSAASRWSAPFLWSDLNTNDSIVLTRHPKCPNKCHETKWPFSNIFRFRLMFDAKGHHATDCTLRNRTAQQ